MHGFFNAILQCGNAKMNSKFERLCPKFENKAVNFEILTLNKFIISSILVQFIQNWGILNT